MIYPKRYQAIFGHHLLREAIKERTITDDDLAFFNSELSDFVISSEDFISLDKSDFEYLRRVFDSKKIVVLFTWRRASFKLYSIWQETIKHGGTQNFFSYYHEHLAKPGASQMLSADLKLGMFCNVFGKANVKVIDYEASTSNNSLLQDFVSVIGLNWDASFITPENNVNAVNRSMNIEDIEIIRALNQIMFNKYDKRGAWVRNKYSELCEKSEPLNLVKLKSIISNFVTTLTVGNYFIDHRCEKLMCEKFSSNIVNYQPNVRTRTLAVAESDWMFLEEAQSIVRELCEQILDIK
jgi:hypothetical protein